MDALGVVRLYRELCESLGSVQASSRGIEVTAPLAGRCRGRKCKSERSERARDGVGYKCSRCGNAWPTETVLEFHAERRHLPPREQQILLMATIGCALRDLMTHDRRTALVLAAYSDADGLPSYQREHKVARLIRTTSDGWAPEKRERYQYLERADEYMRDRLGNALEKNS